MLSTLAKNGKAHWNYPAEWLKLWEEDLTIDLHLLNDAITFIIKIDKQIQGFCLLFPSEDFFELEHLWIDTKLIGKGVGGHLMDHVLKIIQKQTSEIRVSADPNAEGFYSRYGFIKYANQKSSPEGRTIPRMKLKF